MPSAVHDGLVELFRRDPDLVRDLARASGFDVPAHDAVEVTSTEVGVIPSRSRSDVLLLFRRDMRVVFAIVVEVQRSLDPDKEYAWPLYVAAAAHRHRCAVLLLVYATTEDLVRWARFELPLRSLSGLALTSEGRPAVLGPGDIPLLTEAEAHARPYLAALSATARANGPGGMRAVHIALDAAEQLPRDTSVIVRDTIFAALDDAMRLALTKDPAMQNYVLKSEIMRQWRAEAITEGREEGREESLAKARDALRRLLLTTLRTRSLPIDEDTHARVTAERNLDTLERWCERALSAASIEALFAD